MARIDDIPATFDPSTVEGPMYREWMERGYFTADAGSDKEPFTIVMPPPNITGQLHMGHALDNTLPDILIRWKRMQGYEALWVPGTDHASIATEAKIVDKLTEEGKTKQDLGREGFLEEAWAWKDKYGSRIIEQLKRMGFSCDWTRERFTMDKGLSNAVQTVFLDLYSKDLIYRGKRMVNWCPSCRTTISDIEVVYEEQPTSLWHLRYPRLDGKGCVVVATTRPETMLGDTAVAVNPEDERYKDLVGQTVLLPLVNREIPVIADAYVDPEFGTGCVKITPAHDPNDYEIGLRHDLELIEVLTDDAHIVDGYGRYSGMTREEARDAVAADLEAQDLIEKIEPYRHNVGTCQRCHTIVEPRAMLQWFVRMEPLAEPAIEAVRDGSIRFIPERFEKIYFNWMENIRDWCISRQLWWGHRIPAWHCAACAGATVSAEQPERCEHCGSKDLKQDEDTLDTWFSSALWPFSTLGWPEDTADMRKFYPTDVMVTGYDIIFFWVARMIFSALEQTGEIPFHTVFIHGIVRDEEGRKMSKSLGNGIDPLDVIDEYGADALRYALVNGTSPGNDQRFLEETVASGRAFINKIWNAARFVLMNLPDEIDLDQADPARFETEDRWILSRLDRLTREVQQNLEHFELGVALGKIYAFIWEEYCDWYLEMVKYRLHKETASSLEARAVLVTVLRRALQLLHPFMPFVTEELYGYLPATREAPASESIMISAWPAARDGWSDPAAERHVQLIMEATRQIRNIRAGMNIAPSRRSALYVVAEDETLRTLFADGAGFLERLAGISDVFVGASDEQVPAQTVTAVVPGAELYLPLADLVDLDEERRRVEKQLAETRAQIGRQQGKLGNEAFVSKAPEAVVQKERDKLADLEKMEQSLDQRLRGLTD